MLAVVGIGVVAGLYWAIWFTLLVPYYVFVYFGSKAGFSVTALAGATVTALWGSLSGQMTLTIETAATILLFWLLILAVAISSYVGLTEWAGRMRADQLTRDLQADLARMRASSDEALAAVRERNHLAREIHDGLGHYLTVINVQLEKALAYREIDPPVADGAVAEARRMTEAALEEVRAGLGVMRTGDDGATLATLVNRLVANMAGGPLSVSVRVEGSEEGFSRHSLAALYRAAQEGLTNVQKHAGAGKVRLDLSFDEEAAILSLADDGRGFDPAYAIDPKQDGGYGLKGLRERLDLAGGRLEVVSKPGAGSTLTAMVPRNPVVR